MPTSLDLVDGIPLRFQKKWAIHFSHVKVGSTSHRTQYGRTPLASDTAHTATATVCSFGLKAAKQRGIRREKYTSLKNADKATFYSPVETKAAVLVSRNTEVRMFVVDSGASMHMLRKKDLSSDDMHTLRRSRNPTTVMTANGEVQTNEEAQVYVHDLDLFVTVQLLENTPAVLSLGKLCSEDGYCYEWTSGQNPRLTKHGSIITCTMDKFVPLVAPGHHLPAAARLQHRDQRISQIIPKDRKHHQIQ